jgi:hypothetical protein
MFAIEAEVAPPCITGHLPAEFVSCPLMFISCSVRVTDIGKSSMLGGTEPRCAPNIGTAKSVRFCKRRFRLAPGNILIYEFK